MDLSSTSCIPESLEPNLQIPEANILRYTQRGLRALIFLRINIEDSGRITPADNWKERLTIESQY